MPDHLKDGLVAHFSLLAVSHSRLAMSHSALAENHKRQQVEIQVYRKEIKVHQEEMKALERRKQEEINTMRGEVDKLKKQTEYFMSLNMQIFPIDFRVKNPYRCTMSNRWSSTPFYSHSQGYKLQVYFCNSVFSFFIHCYLMQGDFDDYLEWPFKAEMKLVLLNRQPQGHDYKFNIKLEGSKPSGDGALDPVMCGGYSPDFFNLDPYRCSGCLHIRVVSIQF
jgi:hypothetical protein